MNQSVVVGIIAFLVVSGLFLAGTFFSRRFSRQRERVRSLVSTEGPARGERDGLSEFFSVTLPRLGTLLMPVQDETAKNTQLRTLLIQAGFYKPEHMAIFAASKMVLACVPLVGFIVGAALQIWLLSAQWALVTAFLMFVSWSLPGMWVNRQKENRQARLRNMLPDALDVIMICLEGGLTLSSALIRVATELRTVHPELAIEMNIVQRQIQMGHTAGEALRRFADRCDLDEARSLASAVLQSERFGASLVASIRIQADMLRLRRIQQAEEKAHKASVQVLFPTLLLIFPAVFIVLVGPAGMQIVDIFSKMNAAAETATTDYPTTPP